jgi:multiple sugar transport system permease protein
MSTENDSIPTRPKKRNWTPYLLILPTIIYLILFFAWPMVRGLSMAVWDSDALLTLKAEPSQESANSGQLPQGTAVKILEQQGNVIPPEELAKQSSLLTEVWFQVEGEDVSGQTVTGWTSETRVRVRAEDDEGNPTSGTVRRKLGSSADPSTSLYAEPNENSEVVGQLEAKTKVSIVDQVILEVWFLVSGENQEKIEEGWAQSRYIQVFKEGTAGRVDRGNSGELTAQFIQKMVNDRFFKSALLMTLLLTVLIIPVQFVLAIIMALVIQAELRWSSLILYIFAIPLVISDLAAGILWFAIFTQHGYLNSILQGLGLIGAPVTYLSADTRYWIVIAIWLAEVWRATAIVMIIVVSGLQAISKEVLEAAELFGASMWQRVRYITIPLLRPSIQVALILRTIFALQIFAVVVALSGGDVVTSLANETYRQYSDLRNPNVAAAYATLILVLSMLIAGFYLYTIRTQEETTT